MPKKIIPTSQISRAALDWAVAVAVGKEPSHHWSPSSDWSHGGPLIQEYVVVLGEDDSNPDEPFYAECRTHAAETGETYLIAACRAIVASYFGLEVEVPEEIAEYDAH